jgi:hypothetical protein
MFGLGLQELVIILDRDLDRRDRAPNVVFVRDNTRSLRDIDAKAATIMRKALATTILRLFCVAKRKGYQGSRLVISTHSAKLREILLRSIAFARDDGPRQSLLRIWHLDAMIRICSWRASLSPQR